MSSVRNNLELQLDDEDHNPQIVCELDGGLVGLGDLAEAGKEPGRVCLPDPEVTHANLTRFHWTRRAIEEVLRKHRIIIGTGAELGKTGRDTKKHFFVPNPIIEVDEVPWLQISKPIYSVAFMGQTSKMACPSWDVPAGGFSVGGTCIGAEPAQSTTEPKLSTLAKRDVEKKLKVYGQGVDSVEIGKSICFACYANGGKYGATDVQLGEVLRYWWTAQMLKTESSAREWVSILASNVLLACDDFPTEHIDGIGDVRAFRIHTSGDFFSPAYARAWIAVTEAVGAKDPSVRFWAPTRTWVRGEWVRFWQTELARKKHQNFTVRPSAYHFGDGAPRIDGLAAGSCSLYRTEAAHGTTVGPGTLFNAGHREGLPPDGGMEDSDTPRYDWGCRTYDTDEKGHTCKKALSPDGKTGCRACWVHPELAINYRSH